MSAPKVALLLYPPHAVNQAQLHRLGAHPAAIKVTRKPPGFISCKPSSAFRSRTRVGSLPALRSASEQAQVAI